jgi:glyoxylate reductase
VLAVVAATVDEALLELLPDLRLVANYGVGYDGIDVEACARRGVAVTNTPEALGVATADLTMALVLATRRRLVEGDGFVREGKWASGWFVGDLIGDEIGGATLGVIGPGRIGSAVATRARAFGMDVVGVRRGERMHELLATSDIVSVHAPLTQETHHLIDADALAKMKRGAYLINTARGALVDESALCDSLEAGTLRGAALDVYEHEPEVNRRLLAMKNVVLAPHIGSATEEARNAMGRIAATNVLLFLRGSEPLHRVV